MKKILLFTAILFASITMGNAQTASDNATLTLKLYPVQAIMVNPNQKSVVLDYNSISKYRDGVSLLMMDHLTVFSTGGFEVKARSSKGPTIGSEAGDKSIMSTSFNVIASEGSKNPLRSNYGSVSLNDADGDNLISNHAGAGNNTFNITYAGLGNYGFINSLVEGGNPTVYQTEVIYTITPL